MGNNDKITIDLTFDSIVILLSFWERLIRWCSLAEQEDRSPLMNGVGGLIDTRRKILAVRDFFHTNVVNILH